MSKYTSGPWWTNGFEVGTVPTMATKVAKVSGWTTDEVEANARLIAAAPQMLEALEAVVRVADRATVEFDMARAAIKAAKGEI